MLLQTTALTLNSSTMTHSFEVTAPRDVADPDPTVDEMDETYLGNIASRNADVVRVSVESSNAVG